MTPLLTAITGTNADLIPHILTMYGKPGMVVADVTYGNGVFWRNVDTTQFDFRPTDIETGTDLRRLPYDDHSIDLLVLDPPYMHYSLGAKASIDQCYKGTLVSHESVMRLYTGGILEAARVLHQGGLILIKCQDEIESGRQHFSHAELLDLLDLLGFQTVDLFVLVQNGTPTMRVDYQKTARKNHSYALVARLRR